jgi:anhydro-N-acetylmuramic acid kinase
VIYAIGLMSGTSADGVSAALVRLSPRSLEPVLLMNRPYTSATQRWILSLRGARDMGAPNFRMGEILARAALDLLRVARRRGFRPEFIGSHGQTIGHRSGVWTLQIGEPSIIAERTGLTTVADFRPRDMAAGGQGAPLVPFFDHFVFSGRAPCAMLNIGGIANLTLLARDPRAVRAFDTGPGNCMIDEAVRRLTRGRNSYDESGKIAALGRLDGTLLDRLLADPFPGRRPPKSTDPSCYLGRFFESAVVPTLRRRPMDAIATLTYYTAASIAAQTPDFDVIVSGGGVYNRTLMNHLRSMLFPRKCVPISEYGYHPLAKEPACFALLAYRALRGEPNHLPAATGARRTAVLGKIVPGDGFRALMKRMRS